MQIKFMEKKKDGSKVIRNRRQEEIVDFKHYQSMQSLSDCEERIDKNSNPISSELKPNQDLKRDVTQFLKIRVSDWKTRHLEKKTSLYRFSLFYD